MQRAREGPTFHSKVDVNGGIFQKVERGKINFWQQLLLEANERSELLSYLCLLHRFIKYVVFFTCSFMTSSRAVRDLRITLEKVIIITVIKVSKYNYLVKR